jgi:hypothetical protein
MAYLGPSSGINFKLTGNWNDAIAKLSGLDVNIKAACLKAQIVVGKKVVEKVKGHLRRQDLGWPRLNTKYKRRKIKKGLDPRTLISTRTYLDNIDMWSRKNGWHLFVGVKKGVFSRNANGKKNRIDVATIASYHEFARTKKRKRPLWNPTFQELGGSRGIRKIYLNEIERNLRGKGYGSYLRRLKTL